MSLDLVASTVERSPGQARAVSEAVRSIHHLAGGLYERLAGTDGNLALSPFSVAVALGMTVNGAVGATAEEIRQVLDVADLNRFNGGLNALSHALTAQAGSVERGDGSKARLDLDVASTLFGDRSTRWRAGFLDVLARDYGAGMQVVDFVGGSEAARTAINAWTAQRTNDKIQHIIPSGVLDELTRLVLVNALYLKAPWEDPFEASATGPGPFHVDDGPAVPVPTMHGWFRVTALGVGDGWRSVRLPYAGSGLAMTVVLPEPGQISRVEAAVAGGGLPVMLDSAREAMVELSLPKWSFRGQQELTEPLTTLGMERAFDPTRADFSAMVEEATPLCVSAVLHETFVAVDEEGTEAAAATAAVMMVGSAMPRRYQPFVVDRPYLFVIHDVTHTTPLFLGRVNDPGSA